MSAAVRHPGGSLGPLGQGLAKGAADPDPRPTLLVTTVDIGGGRSARVELREGDHPVEAARAFCAAHGLPDSIVAPLAQHIWDNLGAAPTAEEEGEDEERGEEQQHAAPQEVCGGGKSAGP